MCVAPRRRGSLIKRGNYSGFFSFFEPKEALEEKKAGNGDAGSAQLQWGVRAGGRLLLRHKLMNDRLAGWWASFAAAQLPAIAFFERFFCSFDDPEPAHGERNPRTAHGCAFSNNSRRKATLFLLLFANKLGGVFVNWG